MISHFFMLSARGEAIISRAFRQDFDPEVPETFFQQHQKFPEAMPPIWMNTNGHHYFSIERSGIYFVVTTQTNVSPSLVMDWLDSCITVVKDYCGILSEESILVNQVLIYELLDEMIDAGYIQNSSASDLKQYVFNQPIPIKADTKILTKLANATDRRFTSASSSNKSIISSTSSTILKRKTNEIYLDLLESLSATFSASGSLVNSSISGSVVIKSFMTGLQPLLLSLNSDLIILSDFHPEEREEYLLQSGGKRGAAQQAPGYRRAPVCDHMNFHVSVDTSRFGDERVLVLRPQEGEYRVLNYSSSNSAYIQHPFVLSTDFSSIILESTGSALFTVSIKSVLVPDAIATNTVITIPLPQCTTAVIPVLSQPDGQSITHDTARNVLVWKISKFPGGTTFTTRAKLSLRKNSMAPFRKDYIDKSLGDISMKFDIPMFTCSGIIIRYLRLMNPDTKKPPNRWVRYITNCNNYTQRTS